MDLDIRGNVQRLFDDEGMLDILLGVEEYLDNADLYVFANWIDGELVEGPVVSKYWVECTFKYPLDAMPDPRGAYLFENQGTKIMVRQDVELVPLKYAKDFDDFQQDNQHKVKMEEVPVLLVKFVIPRRLVDASSIEEYQMLDDDMEQTDTVPQEMEQPEMEMEEPQEEEQM